MGKTADERNRDILITVITVCRNAEKTIGRTIESVVRQTFKSIEYIIVDGMSEDGTLPIIKEMAVSYPIRFISEPDNGIYDAMNKGIRMAHGDYIHFLNAGDIFSDAFVVEKAAGFIRKSRKDIFFGNIMYRYPDGTNEMRNYGPICSKRIYYYTGDCINHQAIFAAGDCLRGGFDISYRICADREWMMRMCKEGRGFAAMSFTVCEYSLAEDSASVANKELYGREADACVKRYFPCGYWIYRIFEFFRNNVYLSNALHYVYRVLFIRDGE